MKTKHDWSRLDAMSEEQRHAAALADPDAQPLSDADMNRMHLTPRLKIIRRALGLTQEEFAARYRIPLGTLRDWEQGAKQPARRCAPIFGRSPAIRLGWSVHCTHPSGSRGEVRPHFDPIVSALSVEQLWLISIADHFGFKAIPFHLRIPVAVLPACAWRLPDVDMCVLLLAGGRHGQT